MNTSTNSKQYREIEKQRISGTGSFVGISDFDSGQWTSTSQCCRPLEMGKISSGIDSPRIAVYYVAQKKWSRNSQRNRFIERVILEIKVAILKASCRLFNWVNLTASLIK